MYYCTLSNGIVLAKCYFQTKNSSVPYPSKMDCGEDDIKKVIGFADFASSQHERVDADGVEHVGGAQTVVCEFCNLELNSEMTFDSHIRGSRHVVDDQLIYFQF